MFSTSSVLLIGRPSKQSPPLPPNSWCFLSCDSRRSNPIAVVGWVFFVVREGRSLALDICLPSGSCQPINAPAGGGVELQEMALVAIGHGAQFQFNSKQQILTNATNEEKNTSYWQLQSEKVLYGGKRQGESSTSQYQVEDYCIDGTSERSRLSILGVRLCDAFWCVDCRLHFESWSRPLNPIRLERVPCGRDLKYSTWMIQVWDC